MTPVERGNLIRIAARTLLAHHEAGRVCDPLSLEWARFILRANPVPKVAPVEADEEMQP